MFFDPFSAYFNGKVSSVLFAQQDPPPFYLAALGLLVKSVEVPERFAPGKFDLWGSSHQWWHVLINTSMFTRCVRVTSCSIFRLNFGVVLLTRTHTLAATSCSDPT